MTLIGSKQSTPSPKDSTTLLSLTRQLITTLSTVKLTGPKALAVDSGRRPTLVDISLLVL